MKRDNELLKEYVNKIAYRNWHESDTVTTECLLELKNGFEIIGFAQCFDPEDFDNELGKFFAMQDAVRYLRLIDDFIVHAQGQYKQWNKEHESGEEK